MSQLLQGLACPIVVTDAITAPDHYHNGLPYEADGSLAVDGANVDHIHQGLPFTALGRLTVGIEGSPVRFGNGAAPFDVVDRLCITLIGAQDHTSAGVCYDIANRIVMVAA